MGAGMNEYDLFIQMQNSDETKRMYARWLNKFNEQVNKHYSEVTDADVVQYRLFVDSGPWAAATKVIAWKAPKSFFNWLVTSGRLLRSPFAAVRGFANITNQIPRIPNAEEAKRILAAIQPESTSEWRERAAVYLCANGLRISEVSTLRTSDYFPTGDSVPFVRVIGKGQKQRTIPLAAPVNRAVQDWLSHDSVESEYLLHEYDGSPITARQVRSAMDKALDRVWSEDKEKDPRAKRLNLSAHSLRHYYATRLIRAGANVFAVQKMLGHSSVATTQIYVNLDNRDIIEAAGLDPMEAL
jgi:site-specific recombinase XerD